MRLTYAFYLYLAEAQKITAELDRDHTDRDQSLRFLHTIKAGAQMFGLSEVSKLTHAVETSVLENRAWPNDSFAQIKNQIEVERQSTEETRSDFTRDVLPALEDSLKHLALRRGKSLARLNLEYDREVNADLVLQKLFLPLVHVLTNSVVHGIEKVDDRVIQGKPEHGQINLRMRTGLFGGLHFEISDDGQGCRLDTFQILQAGVSAASTLDLESGRGFGLNSVMHEVHALGGEIEIQNDLGSGMKVIFHLPQNVAGAFIVPKVKTA